MKKLTLALALAISACAGFAPNATAQRYDPRIDIRANIDPERGFDRNFRGGDWEGRTRRDLDRLNYEVRQLRVEIGGFRHPRIRARYQRVRSATDRLNYAFDRRIMRGWEIRQRADEIRAEIHAIRRELRFRGR